MRGPRNRSSRPLSWGQSAGNISVELFVGRDVLFPMTENVEDFEARAPRTLTPEERKARDATRRADAEQAMREHEAAQKAFYKNRERLKAERLAREARTP